MPQLNKGGKYVFGWSIIGSNGQIVFPDKILEEYNLTLGENVILMSGSKRSGAFSLSSKKLLKNSSLSKILKETPQLANYTIDEGSSVKYKGRFYCWLKLHENKSIYLPQKTLDIYNIKEGDMLLSIRGSNIAFDFAIKGPLVERAKEHNDIEIFIP